METSTIWVTGAGGLIGHYLCRTLSQQCPEAKLIPLKRTDLDLLDFKAVAARFSREEPALIFHCAALSRSPDCEANPELARRLNVDATRILATLGAKMVFLSSDQVFDGRDAPYAEDARHNPLSVYARTKSEAESVVLSNGQHLVIRTSLNGGASPTGDRGFNEQLRNTWQAGRETVLFVDEFRCPIHARETARAVATLARRGCSGIYHVAGSESMSRWDLGLLVAKRWPALNPKLRAGKLSEYKGPARAPDLRLDCSRAAAVLGGPLPAIASWLEANPQEVF